MKFNLSYNNINYIKIIYKDNEGFSHCTKAAIKELNKREIYACAKFDDGLFIRTPQDVELNIAAENGLYKAFTQLLYIKNEAPYVYFMLKTPEDMDYRQSREYFRVKLNENAVISYEENEQIVQIPCETYDISANGVRPISDNNSVKFPESVFITIYFPSKTVKTEAKFIRNDNEDDILKTSFYYTNLSEVDSDYISQLCIQKQLEIRRKNFM